MALKLNLNYVGKYADKEKFDSMRSEVSAAHKMLTEGTGLGSDFLGWLDLPVNYDKDEFRRIKESAEKIKKDSEVLVVLGIGGSYLGARAVIEFIKSNNYNLLKKDPPDIYFGGNTISSSAVAELMQLIDGRDFSINVISKSGTTTVRDGVMSATAAPTSAGISRFITWRVMPPSMDSVSLWNSVRRAATYTCPSSSVRLWPVTALYSSSGTKYIWMTWVLSAADAPAFPNRRSPPSGRPLTLISRYVATLLVCPPKLKTVLSTP